MTTMASHHQNNMNTGGQLIRTIRVLVAGTGVTYRISLPLNDLTWVLFYSCLAWCMYVSFWEILLVFVLWRRIPAKFCYPKGSTSTYSCLFLVSGKKTLSLLWYQGRQSLSVCHTQKSFSPWRHSAVLVLAAWWRFYAEHVSCLEKFNSVLYRVMAQ